MRTYTYGTCALSWHKVLMTSFSQNNLKLFAVIFVPKILLGHLPVHLDYHGSLFSY